MGRLRIYMAPLQGLTEAPFRNAFEKRFGGVDVYYTPFVRRERGGLRRKDVRDLLPGANKVGRLVPQIMAASAEEAGLILSEVVPYGYREIDLNMGCAFPMLAKKGKGCGILPEPGRVRGLLQVAGRYPDVSFSVKMRLGYEDAAECMELLPVLNEARLARVVVHARTGRQGHEGGCDREAFLRFARGCRHPVVYNGGVATVEDLDELQREMPFLEGVMMGRGLLAAPWVAIEYREGAAWSVERRMSSLRMLHADLLDHYAHALEGGERQLLTKMKSFWEYMCPGGDRKCRKKIRKARTAADYAQAVSGLLGGCQDSPRNR